MGQLFKTTKKPVNEIKLKEEKYRKTEPVEDDEEENPLDELNEEEEEYEEEEEESPKASKTSMRTLVVKELPVQQVRKVKLEDGTWVKCITIEEALTELMGGE